MERLPDYEFVIFGMTLIALLLAEYVGAWIATRLRPVQEGERSHLSQVTGVSLSILALLLGFSFSAAINRYDQRKNYEQAEASAISSEYMLADLLPDADAAQLHTLLQQYVQLRIQYFESDDSHELASIRMARGKLEAQMWPIVERNAKANQTPIMGQVVSGMNAMLSAPGYSLAAALDRIPDAVWMLLSLLSFLSAGLVGYMGYGRQWFVLRLVLPVFLATAFFVIATLDSQRRGMVRVLPENLIRVQREIQ